MGVQETELERITRERDEAVTWIRVVSDELIMAGGEAGDRTVVLANLRRFLRERKIWLQRLTPNMQQ